MSSFARAVVKGESFLMRASTAKEVLTVVLTNRTTSEESTLVAESPLTVVD